MLNAVLEKFHLTIQQRLTEGDRCQGVYLVNDGEISAVLKVSDNASEIEEIRRNIVGYQRMGRLGLESFLPTLYQSSYSTDIAYILMEYLGENFESYMRRRGNVEDYLTLARGIKDVCAKSLHEPKETVLANSLEAFKEIAKTSKEEVIMSYLTSGIELPNILKVFSFRLKKAAFSCWDFKPDNIFLKEGLIKYADPQDATVGVPLVDLGVVAGIIRDVAKLPAAECGYELLLVVGIGEIGKLLELSPAQSYAFFLLGRILQLLKGVKYRHLEGDRKRAKQFAQFAEDHYRLMCLLQL